jgi:hypothetical protein
MEVAIFSISYPTHSSFPPIEKHCCKLQAVERFKFLLIFWSGNLKGRGHLEGWGADVKLILEWILKKWYDILGWIKLAQGRNQWRNLVNTVMNLQIPWKEWYFILADQ